MSDVPPAWRRPGVALLFALGFLATRLVDLGALPVFLDEAMHLDWAFKMAETGRVLGITDGGRYLPIGIWALVAPRFSDPLLAARACSSLFGLLAAAGLLRLGAVLYTEKAGAFAALLYLILPSTLLYDRMALVDSLMVALLVWSLVVGARWAAAGGLVWATALGLLIGAAAITKLYGALLLAVPVLFLLLWRGSTRRGRWAEVQWVHAIALAVMLPIFLELPATLQFVTENVWVFRSGPQGSASILRNLQLCLGWQMDYLTPLGFSLVGLSVLHSLRSGQSADRLLLALWALWCLFFVATGGGDWFPRYLLPGVVPLLLLAAQQWVRLAGDLASRLERPALAMVVPWVLTGLYALSAVPSSLGLLRDPVSARLTGIDRWQYIEDWPAGSRLPDLAGALRRLVATTGDLVVVRELRSGPLLEGLNLLMRGRATGIEFVDVDLLKDGGTSVARRLQAREQPVVVALEQPRGHALMLALDGARLAQPLGELVKPGGKRQLELYCVAGPCGGPAPVAAVVGSVQPADLVVPVEPTATRGPGVDAPGAVEDLRVCSLERGSDSLLACRRALERGLTWPRAAEAQYALGRTLITFGRPGEAAHALRQAMRLLPGDVDQSLAFVESLEVFGRHAEALAVCQDAVRIAAGDAGIHRHLGFNLAWLGRWDEAEAALRQAIALDGSQPQSHNDLGVALWLSGRRQDAVQELLVAIRMDTARARLNLGLVRARLAAGR